MVPESLRTEVTVLAHLSIQAVTLIRTRVITCVTDLVPVSLNYTVIILINKLVVTVVVA